VRHAFSVQEGVLRYLKVSPRCSAPRITPQGGAFLCWQANYVKRMCDNASRQHLHCYNAGMTLVEVTYDLQVPLRPEQLRALGVFANTYGLRRFHVDEQLNRLSFEYDASRLKESQVAHVLRMAKIPVERKV
jgi:hypothetical protein